MRDGSFATELWKADGLQAGEYTVRIFASDYAGNTATKNRDLPITLLDPADIEPPKPERKVQRAKKPSR